MLKFNLQKGRGYDYDMSWNYDQDVMGQNVVMNMGAGYSLDITNDDGKIETINAEFKSFKMNMKLMGMEINVDTDKPVVNETEDSTQTMANVSNKINKVFSLIKGKKFLMKVNKEGEVLEVNGFEQIFSSMADSAGVDSTEREKVMQSVKQQFNEGDIKNRFADIFYIFPQKEVKVGDTWEKEYETVSGKAPIKNHTVYKVKEIEGDMVTLSSKTDITSAQENMKAEGTQTGTFIVDSRSGLVVNAELAQDITFSVNGMSFTMNGKGKIKGTAR
jgi:hypothetical protein